MFAIFLKSESPSQHLNKKVMPKNTLLSELHIERTRIFVYTMLHTRARLSLGDGIETSPVCMCARSHRKCHVR